MFYQRKGTKIYHRRRDCSQVPSDVLYDPHWRILSDHSNTGAQLCPECMERDMRDMQDGFTWKVHNVNL